jgi:hypothetical protein
MTIIQIPPVVYPPPIDEHRSNREELGLPIC